MPVITEAACIQAHVGFDGEASTSINIALNVPASMCQIGEWWTLVVSSMHGWIFPFQSGNPRRDLTSYCENVLVFKESGLVMVF